MSIYVACRCGQAFMAPPELAGHTVACTVCQHPIHVPHGLAPISAPQAFTQATAAGPSYPYAHQNSYAPYDPYPPQNSYAPQAARSAASDDDSPLVMWLAIGGGGMALLLVFGLFVFNAMRSNPSPPVANASQPVAATSPPLAGTVPPPVPASATNAPPPLAGSVVLPKHGQVVPLPGGTYEVWLPVAPKTVHETQISLGVSVNATMLQAEVNANYAFLAGEFIGPISFEENWDTYVNNLRKSPPYPGSRRVAEKEITFAGKRGIEFKYESPEFVARYVSFADGNKVFMLVVIGKETDLQGADAKAFFGSFRKRS